MEHSLKRKAPENGDNLLFDSFSLDDLNEDLFERVLSWLPTSSFFRLTSVCKRWKSAAASVSFKLACSQIPSRDPWFFMVAPSHNQSVIFDSAENGWKRLNHPNLLLEDSNQSCIPVAASGGLVCYRTSSGNFIVSNPVTGSCCKLPPLNFTSENQSLNAVVMRTAFNDPISYKIVLVFGELPNLSFKVYNSSSACWEDEHALGRKVDDSSMDCDSTDDNVVYFLSKAGNVVASSMQRSPTKQYSSVITNKDGQEIVYFLSSSGTVVACNLTCKCFFEYPRLLPVFCEYSIDIVECNGEMLVVLLSEFLESTSLRVWKFDEANRCWQQIAAMPVAMSHECCFANVVLQCLSFTRPLVAYLLEKGHRKECTCNDWCFLCEFESHVQRARISQQAFSPMNILSRLPNIGGTLGYGRQEDAHEFMRFSIDTMQSVCLDEFGGEKAVPSNLQETTIIQHIFGGRLQSEVICTKCDKTSNQYESMMDLTVEIHGDAASLEECLDQFTVKEWLDGDNMYKCEGCQDYVKAWKRLTVKCAPNILTIALKRFQSGRFGKLNKRVAFPETLNLSPYMSEAGDGSDIYKLYAVVVHIDMLNASFFGHYICYIKDFLGQWYRIDDSKVACVELEEVLSQGAYMLLYRRCSARPSSLQIQTTESSVIVEQRIVEVEPNQTEQAERLSNMKALTCSRECEVSPSDISPELKVSSSYEYESSVELNSEANREQSEDTNMIDVESTDISNDISYSADESSYLPISHDVEDLMDVDMGRPIEETSGCAQDQDGAGVATSCPSQGLPNDFSFLDKHSSVSVDYRNVEQDSEHIDAVKCKLLTVNEDAYYSNGYDSANKSAIPHEDAGTLFSGVAPFPAEKDIGNGIKKVEISADKLIM